MESPPALMTKTLLLDVLSKSFEDISLEEVDEVMELHLEFKKILKIDLLNGFTSLTKLNLNANRIEKIEGLDCLVNLKWLNLSFNRIKKIEGLDNLRKLEVLELSNNRIPVVENMDALENLTHFAIANNLISELENVLYLRRFTKLFQVYFFGNPITEMNDYLMFIAAFLPTLRGVDHILLDKKTKDKAFEKYKSTLNSLKLEDLQKQELLEAQMKEETELKLHKDAFVESFNVPCLFMTMIEDSSETTALFSVPEMTAHLQACEEQMGKLFKSLFDIGLAEHKLRETELNAYLSGQEDVMTYYRQEALQMMEEYDEEYDKRTLSITRLSDPYLIEAELSPFTEKIKDLIKRLKMIRFDLMTNLEDNIKTFDNSISEMVDDFCKTATKIFDQCRSLENDYYEKLQETAIATVERMQEIDVDEDNPDEVPMLFKDKDAVMSALATNHENILQKINEWENQLLTRVSVWKVTLIKEIQESEIIWDCVRLSDVSRYGEYLTEQIHKAYEMSPKS